MVVTRGTRKKRNEHGDAQRSARRVMHSDIQVTTDGPSMACNYHQAAGHDTSPGASYPLQYMCLHLQSHQEAYPSLSYRPSVLPAPVTLFSSRVHHPFPLWRSSSPSLSAKTLSVHTALARSFFPGYSASHQLDLISVTLRLERCRGATVRFSKVSFLSSLTRLRDPTSPLSIQHCTVLTPRCEVITHSRPTSH